MSDILKTERLRLRAFTINDAKFIVELMNSPGWLTFIGDRNMKTEEQAIAYLENGPIKSYHENGFGLSMVETKDNGINVGMCGILKRDSLEHPDIGFAFLPDYTGKGYAFEIADATVQYARHTLNLSIVSAITNPENERSIRLLGKIGLKFVKSFRFPDSHDDLLLYSN